MNVGVYLPSGGLEQAAGVAVYARGAEDAGLESVWVGDHLIARDRPFLDSTLRMATAAAVTERVRIGFGVMILALRPVAWAAKQIASLQHLSGGRVLLGVGTGGAVHGDAGWRAAGVPYAERGARTDAALAVLPGLVRGEAVELADGEVTLSPGAPMPPVLIGGGPAAMRRAARFGDEWYPAFSDPARIGPAAEKLAALAAEYGRPAPRLTVSVSVGLGDVPAERIDAQVRGLTEYGMTADEARAALVTGTPERAAERFAALAEAGAHRVIAMPFPGDHLRQIELVGEAAALLRR
ncbi:LLM class flavin-dependent oxidoreductase [Actinomadura sp. 21ATH]|uniref:LLM class flavin-dependent oxidoreductase n=1 Tax=Actinomadura sp. 21ATH TaxID=1735444 RepID=UPI0035BF3BA0